MYIYIYIERDASYIYIYIYIYIYRSFGQASCIPDSSYQHRPYAQDAGPGGDREANLGKGQMGSALKGALQI